MADPISVGELTDVPAPLSPVNAQFHQEVANRIVHRFPNVSAMNAWAAANGSLAFVTPHYYARTGGAWAKLTYDSELQATNTALTNSINANAAAAAAATNAVQANLNATNTNLATYAQGLLAVSYAGFVELNTSTQVVCSVTWTANPGRWYRLVGDIVRINSGAANQDVVFVIENSAGDDYRLTMHEFVELMQLHTPLHMHLLINGLSGSQTWRLAGNTSTGTAQIPSGLRNASNAMLSVEDMGAV